MGKTANEQELLKLFSERVKKLREERGMSKVELASALGPNVTGSHIWYYETGKGIPNNVAMLVKLAQVLNTTVDYLVGNTDHADYVLVKGEELPMLLKNKKVDAIEVLKTEIDENGGISEDTQREALRLLSEAKILRHTKSRVKSSPSSDKTS